MASQPYTQEGVQHYEESAAGCLAAMKGDLGGLLRSKGFMWLATQQDWCVGWSHAGVVLQVRRDMPWFATVPKVSCRRCGGQPQTSLACALA
jgi:G3E family GTPase